ncbi:MAG: putative DNA-binding domain-containing protein [Gammaproteobacteria bacterium]|nr:putative DNA-binding domain-containing protein [Gammaproteobacteria bacterium]
MPELETLQHEFIKFLTNQSQNFSQYISEQPPVDTDIRLGIYHNAYRMRLRETIDSDHPILGSYLGDELYDQLVLGYIEHYPSQVKSLRHFCANIPTYLQHQAPFSQHPILAELAQFERVLLSAFDAVDSKVVAITDLAAINPEQWPDIKLTFHPSTTIFTEHYNSVETWQALKSEQSPNPAVKHPLASYWLVWRNQQRLTEFYHQDPREQELWQHFNAGGDFAQGCEVLSQHFEPDQVPLQAVTLLKNWLSQGIISHIISKN